MFFSRGTSLFPLVLFILHAPHWELRTQLDMLSYSMVGHGCAIVFLSSALLTLLLSGFLGGDFVLQLVPCRDGTPRALDVLKAAVSSAWAAHVPCHCPWLWESKLEEKWSHKMSHMLKVQLSPRSKMFLPFTMA